ncbi:nitrogenase component 1 [Paraclostridium sordellii]|uniref:nitrogenase component 1 n=1 Tax=Paraclostridium sordellii TaxID=1505 RepID=UPI0022E23CC8|nr:nitrogenase component 1 [Paeniclostridium sordellii]
MVAYKYLPVADEKIGMIWTLSLIKDACIIEFGTIGTTHNSVEGIRNLNITRQSNVYSINLDEKDTIYNHCYKLEKFILDVDKKIKPKYIFVVEACVPAIIGLKVLEIDSNLKGKVNSKVLFINENNLNYDYNNGIELGLELFAKDVVKPKEKDENKYNIIGFSIDKYNYRQDINELKRIMKDLFNKELNVVFTINSNIHEIENAASASLNIVLRKEALKAAEYMKEKYGIPYVYKNLYGLKNTIKFIETVKKIDGYELDEEKYNKEICFVKKSIFKIKKRFYFYEESKDCAIFGDFDTVSGISEMMKELGFNVDRKEVIYKVKCSDRDIITSTAELDRMKYLSDKELLMLLGDESVIAMYHNSKADLPISNLNEEKCSICGQNPYMGFKGCVCIINQILNIK